MREEIFESEEEFIDVLSFFVTVGTPDVREAYKLNLIKKSDLEKAKQNWNEIKDESYSLSDTMYVANKISIMHKYMDELEKELDHVKGIKNELEL